MTGGEKRRGGGVKRKIVIYLVVFVLFVLGLLWTFQILLLDGIYSAIVQNTLKSTGDTLVRAIENAKDEEDLTETAQYLAKENEMCISVFRFNGGTGYSIADVHINSDCVLHTLNAEGLLRYYEQAKKADDGIKITRLTPKKGGGGFGAHPSSSLPDSVIYTRAFEMKDGADAVIFINCAMTPVSSTVRTLTVMLLWISVITLLLAVALAYFIAWRVSAPIADVNREAKNLAHNSYDGSKVRRGYREINELSETLTYAARELSKVDRMQKELIANISHDLRTPLTLIEGYTEMMRDIPGENSPENMQVVIDETKRLSTLVSDLLEVSRFQTGKQTIYPAVFDLSEALRDTVSRVMKLYEPDGYKVILEAEGCIYVNADKTRILQVLYNLIGNAANYTGDDKTVTVRESVHDGIVRISVTDTGEGISEEDLPLIWDRYYKVKGTHRRGVGGSGLGLSIVKEILLLHGARFGVSSKPGCGSTFWFELPVAKEKKDAGVGNQE